MAWLFLIAQRFLSFPCKSCFANKDQYLNVVNFKALPLHSFSKRKIPTFAPFIKQIKI